MCKDDAIQALITRWRLEADGVKATTIQHGQAMAKAACAEELAAIVGPAFQPRVKSGLNMSDMFT